MSDERDNRRGPIGFTVDFLAGFCRIDPVGAITLILVFLFSTVLALLAVLSFVIPNF